MPKQNPDSSITTLDVLGDATQQIMDKAKNTALWTGTNLPPTVLLLTAAARLAAKKEQTDSLNDLLEKSIRLAWMIDTPAEPPKAKEE